MPNTPVSHIQSTAPGPPAATAVATPTMLPVPIVAASAVVSAPNWLTSPSPSLLARKREPDRLRQVALDEPQPDGQEEMGADQQNQERRPPDEVAGPGEKGFEVLHAR